MAKFRYLARRFCQLPRSDKQLLSFVASSDDIAQWAGVPRKALEFKDGMLRGFQRQLQEQRILEISEYFENSNNVSPTAVVVAFREGAVKITPVEPPVQGATNDPGDLVIVEIDHHQEGVSTLSDAIGQYLSLVDPRLPQSSDELEDEIEGSPDDYEDSVEDSFVIHDSHLAVFVKSLRSVLRELQDVGDNPEDYDKGQQDLLETVVQWLRPAMLVDGQHRVFGAHLNEDDIPFSVCALLNASWEERVFQFVVVNQKSAPIPTEFLSAIISTSLTQAEIEPLMERLEGVGVNVYETQMMDMVAHEPRSPFKDMIRFQVSGEGGTLSYPGMRRLAKQFRGLNPNSRFESLAAHLCKGERLSEKRIHWQESNKWFDYFCWFWGTIREQYSTAPSGEESLWRPRTQLMRVAVLQIIQDVFLEWCQYSKRKWPDNEEDFCRLVKLCFGDIPFGFFREKWVGVKKIPSPEGRDRIRNALEQMVKNPNFHFRRSRLFRKIDQ